MFFKKLLTYATAASMAFFMAASLFPQIADASVYVHGYTKKNGTYVAPYYRSSPDSSPYNNYSYPGNTNPYTGETAGGNPDTYLNNYYNKTPSYSAPTPSYTFTPPPSCPLFASYDSLSGTCKCNTGYTSNGSSCISLDSYCTGNMGYGAQYDSLKDKCSCKHGYVLGSNGKCEFGSSVCLSKYGYNSSYNSLNNTCGCDRGYLWNVRGDKCISNDDSCTEKYGYNTKYNTLTLKCVCKDGYHVSISGSTCEEDAAIKKTSWQLSAPTVPTYTCESGYRWNAAVTLCEAVPAVAPASTITTTSNPSVTTTCESQHKYSDILKKCICPVGYTEDATGVCITQDVSCQRQFGEQSFYSPDKAQCFCRAGFAYDEKTMKCGDQTVIFSGTPKDRVQLFSCSVVGRKLNKKYYLKGDKILNSLSPKFVICFESETKAKEQGYQKR